MKTPILDHGYIELVEHWGSDRQIIESARMSTDKGFLGWGPTADGKPGDERLLRFLYENKHSTPFEFAGMTIEVQAPIFVFREWHRHRTQSFSELSARYTPMPDLNYIPSAERLMFAGGSNKQARGSTDVELTAVGAESFRDALADSYAFAEESYQAALSSGVPKELARLCVPVGRYSRMRATTDLRNWLAFLTLRMAPNAQWEIRQYANAVGELIAELFPRTWDLFKETPR
jgi:thymidylate synthase (FAD)